MEGVHHEELALGRTAMMDQLAAVLQCNLQPRMQRPHVALHRTEIAAEPPALFICYY